jgi:hypothetical protein
MAIYLNENTELFYTNKYSHFYYFLINRAKSQKRKKKKLKEKDYIYYENHHIFPKGIGGPDISDNTVLLTALEHFYVHWALTYMCLSNTHHNIMLNTLKFWFQKDKRTKNIKQCAKIYADIKQQLASQQSGKVRTRESIEKGLATKRMRGGFAKSEECRQKISNARKGIKFSENHKANLSKATTNHMKNPEVRKIISEQQKNMLPNPIRYTHYNIVMPNGEQRVIKDRNLLCNELGWTLTTLGIAISRTKLGKPTKGGFFASIIPKSERVYD